MLWCSITLVMLIHTLFIIISGEVNLTITHFFLVNLYFRLSELLSCSKFIVQRHIAKHFIFMKKNNPITFASQKFQQQCFLIISLLLTLWTNKSICISMIVSNIDRTFHVKADKWLCDL